MPKDTFYRLADEKRNRILNAAKKEFFRVPYEEASINQIIKNAEIPRGSFYQYFEDKQDLFLYVLSQMHEKVLNNIHQNIIDKKGDIFLVIYDYIHKTQTSCENNACETILNSLKNPELACVIHGMVSGEQTFQQMAKQLESNLLKYIDFSLYKVEDDFEKECFLNILTSVMRDSMRRLFCGSSSEEVNVKEVCTDARKRILYLEKHLRK